MKCNKKGAMRKTKGMKTYGYDFMVQTGMFSFESMGSELSP
jgi:hypothetical protein